MPDIGYLVERSRPVWVVVPGGLSTKGRRYPDRTTEGDGKCDVDDGSEPVGWKRRRKTSE